MIVPIHSIIDVITNSSTSVFVCVSTKSIRFAKELINDILQAGGSKKTADDLFEFAIAPSANAERYIEKHMCDCDMMFVPEEHKDNWFRMSYGEKRPIIDEVMDKILEDPMKHLDDVPGSLVITPKEKGVKQLKLLETFNRIFHVETFRD